MTHVAARDGYAHASISAVITEAVVSRPTFYEYFSDKDDCFLAALGEIQQRLLIRIETAVHEQAPERALAATVGALVDFAASEPTSAQFLMSEPMAGGPRALDARDRGIAELAELIERAQRSSPATVLIPDISAAMVVGSLYRLLSSRLRRGEPNLAGLLDDLLAWIASYEWPLREHRWSSPRGGASPAPSPFVTEAPLHAPGPLPKGRPNISEAEVAENHRQRILFATAQISEEAGYTAAKVTDITKLAGVDGRAFYGQFANKQEAFMAIHELGFQRTMAVAAGAFFAGETWPERVWEALHAFTEFLRINPTIAHIGFVDSSAVGPGAVQRVEDTRIAFTIFLQEGYKYSEQEHPPSPLALEAIAATIFEIAYHQARQGTVTGTSGLLTHMIAIALIPFLGVKESNRFIADKLDGGG
jgi:AcrR family transcriptional regulator